MIWFSKQKEFVAFFREDLQSNCFFFSFLGLSLNRFLILFFVSSSLTANYTPEAFVVGETSVNRKDFSSAPKSTGDSLTLLGLLVDD